MADHFVFENERRNFAKLVYLNAANNHFIKLLLMIMSMRKPNKNIAAIAQKISKSSSKSEVYPPIITVVSPLTILFGGPSGSTIVSPIRQAGILFISTV